MGPLKQAIKMFQGKCAICEFPLVREFPEDFPKSWKFCCNCLYIAKMLTTGGLNEEAWGIYRVGKVKRKITLVGK